ncbi:MAG: CinA family protein [bacterium]
MPPLNTILHLHQYLLNATHTLVTAESCTGGLVAAQMTEFPGSSKYFDRGFVTYSNQAKVEMLGVSKACLDNHGAVSQETAREMAQGAIAHSPADLSLAITGIAGPGGGTTDKPVGTVCFAWCLGQDKTHSKMEVFSGNRLEIRQQAKEYALRELFNLLTVNSDG